MDIFDQTERSFYPEGYPEGKTKKFEKKDLLEFEYIKRTPTYKRLGDNQKIMIQSHYFYNLETAVKLVLPDNVKFQFNYLQQLKEIINFYSEIQNYTYYNNQTTEVKNKTEKIKTELEKTYTELSKQFEQDKILVEIDLTKNKTDIIGEKGGGQLGYLLDNIKEIREKKRIPHKMDKMGDTIYDAKIRALKAWDLKKIEGWTYNKIAQEMNKEILFKTDYPIETLDNGIRNAKKQVSNVTIKIKGWDVKIQQRIGNAKHPP